MEKDVFWKAGVLTVIILIVGIQLGIWLDSGRLDEIKTTLTVTDLDFSDARLQSIYYQTFLVQDKSICASAIKANLDFNNKIYQQGIQIDRAEIVNRFTSGILLERRRYALLQLQFWMNAVNIKRLCESDYSTLLYVYRYDTFNYSSVEIPQKLQSATLLDLKEKCGPKLMLSPLPLDLNLTSIDLLASSYRIDQTPALIINNDTVLFGFRNLTELEQYVNC